MFLPRAVLPFIFAIHMMLSVMPPAEGDAKVYASPRVHRQKRQAYNPYNPYNNPYARPRGIDPYGPPPPPIPPPLPGTYGQKEVPLPGTVLGVQDNCIGYGAAGMCEQCQVSDQCSEGMTCCPVKKLCVKNSCTDCSGEGAKCNQGCGDDNVHSQFGGCKCDDSRFPHYWAPQCGNKYNEDKNQYKFQEKTQYSTNQCFPKYVTKFKDVCIDYEEEECTTGHTEKCEDTHFKSCNTIPNSKHETKCQTVIEKICQMKKFPNHEKKNTKQNAVRCHKSRKRICDTKQELDRSSKDEHLCVDVPKPKCRTEYKTLYEESCKTEYRFTCRFPQDGSGYGHGTLNHLYAEERYQLQPGIPSSWNINQKPVHGMEEVPWEKYCEKTPVEDCQTTPRQRHFEVCEQITEQECEKVTNANPKPVEKQACKFVDFDQCEVVEESKEEWVDIPRYDEDCKDVPKELCGKVGTTELKVNCETDIRPICTYHPTERKCTKTPRQYCTKAPYTVKTTDCSESYTSQIGQPVPQPPSYGYGNGYRQRPFQGMRG